MKILKISKLNKIASLTFSIPELITQQKLHNIHAIGYFLNLKLFENLRNNEQDNNYYLEHHIVDYINTVTMDGYDVDSPTGVINFYIEGINPKRLNIYINILINELKKHNITVGNLKKEISNMFSVPVVRIPIIKNEHSSIRPPINISLANENAFFIFNKILKYNRDLLENPLFNAEELKKRIEYYLGEEVFQEAPFAGQPYIQLFKDKDTNELNENELKDMFTNFDFSGRNALSNYTQQQTRHTLETIKRFCEWAINNGFKQILLS